MNKLLFAFLIFFTLANRTTAVSSSQQTLFAAGTISDLYEDCCLEGLLSKKAFETAMGGYAKYEHAKQVLAICDFSKPSTQERFFILDLKSKKLLMKTLVAHGKNSGELMATKFSNTPESLKSSLGFFLIGNTLQAPKHGLSLVLDGLDHGINNNARTRGIIIHGADYVSEKFVHQYGVLGKSFGCPAIPNDRMQEAASILKDGAILYIGAE